MRTVVQRVTQSTVSVDKRTVGKIQGDDAGGPGKQWPGDIDRGEQIATGDTFG